MKNNPHTDTERLKMTQYEKFNEATDIFFNSLFSLIAVFILALVSFATHDKILGFFGLICLILSIWTVGFNWYQIWKIAREK